jgi:hypothetical protein
MDDITPGAGPHRVGPVAPDLIATGLFLFSEYLRELEAEQSEEDEQPADIDTRAVLDLLSEELGTDVATTLNLFMRLTALRHLLATSPGLSRLMLDEETGSLSEDAIVAAARLDLYVHRTGDERRAEFNIREFREALEDG